MEYEVKLYETVSREMTYFVTAESEEHARELAMIGDTDYEQPGQDEEVIARTIMSIDHEEN